MKIGIIIHSHTGNTLSVAKGIQEKMIGAGHTVNLEQVVPVNKNPSAAGNIQLKNIPDANEYDVLIIGAPVWAFSLSAVMKAYLLQLSLLKSKEIACFVTQSLPYRWMGGNRAISQIQKMCQDKDGTVICTGIVNWKSKHRDKMIAELIEKFGTLF